eukprot:4223929-Prorocentrum_lima.AAC.1
MCIRDSDEDAGELLEIRSHLDEDDIVAHSVETLSPKISRLFPQLQGYGDGGDRAAFKLATVRSGVRVHSQRSNFGRVPVVGRLGALSSQRTPL